MKLSPSLLAFLAARPTGATERGAFDSDIETGIADAGIPDEILTTTETFNRWTVDPLAVANSPNSISCWDGLSLTDRENCQNSGITTPECGGPSICKRVENTCGYYCVDPTHPKHPEHDLIDDGMIVWNLLLNPVSGDNPTLNLKEYEFVEKCIDENKFGFTCDSVDGQRGYINLPHIPKSPDYFFDDREIKILQANRYDDYIAAKESKKIIGIFQNSDCGSQAENNPHVGFAGVFENESCLSRMETIYEENGDVFDIKEVIVGYDDLVYTSAAGNRIILQHGQSWSFQCRTKLNGEAETFSEGKVNGTPVEVEDEQEVELDFDFSFYTDETYNETTSNPVIDISPGQPLEPFYIGLTMEKYGQHWAHLQTCTLFDAETGFEEIIVQDGCSTDEILYQLQGGQIDRTEPLLETIEIKPFKALNNSVPSFTWNVKCTFVACDEENDTYCKLDDACPGRYDGMKALGRKRRSADEEEPTSYTVEATVEHPCALVNEHTSICDGDGENCWTVEVCAKPKNYLPNHSAVSTLSSALAILSLLLK